MRLIELPTSLAGDYAVEVIDGSFVSEVHDVMASESAAVLGRSHLTEEDVRSLINPPEETECVQLLVRRRSDGAPVQWWSAFRDPGVTTVDVFVRGRPDVAEAAADQLAAAGWGHLFQWIRDQPLSRGEVPLQTVTLQGNETSRRWLRSAGFSNARTSWGMSGAVDGAPAPPGPAELSIVVADDGMTLHRLLETCFADHYGFEPRTFDDWWALETTRPGHDPALWRLGVVDGVPVAAMVMSRRSASDGALYVQDLVTLPEFRRRGFASCLLAHAFVVAAEEGLTAVELHVDSANAHHAPEVYRRAGMEVTYARETSVRTLAC